MRLQKFRVPGFRFRSDAASPSRSISSEDSYSLSFRAQRGIRFFFRFSQQTAKSFLAVILSVACVPLGVGFPLLVAAAPAAPAKDKKPKQDAALKGLPITELSADEAILHALNRLAYGPRPGDIERVKQVGLAKWIEQQLNPNSIDDKAVEARLQDYPTLRMPTSKLIEEYPQPKQAEKQAERRAQAQERQEQRRANAADAAPPADKGVQSSQTQSGSSGGQDATANSGSASQSAAENPNAASLCTHSTCGNCARKSWYRSHGAPFATTLPWIVAVTRWAWAAVPSADIANNAHSAAADRPGERMRAVFSVQASASRAD